MKLGVKHVEDADVTLESNIGDLYIMSSLLQALPGRYPSSEGSGHFPVVVNTSDPDSLLLRNMWKATHSSRAHVWKQLYYIYPTCEEEEHTRTFSSTRQLKEQFSVYTYNDSLVHTRLPSEYFNFPKISLALSRFQPASRLQLQPACLCDLLSAGEIGAWNSP